jgi:hypothetical protein
MKRFGMGIAIAASALVSHSQAQILYTIDDAAATTNSVTSKLSDTPIIQSIHRYALDDAGNLNGQITIAGTRPTGLRVFMMQDKKIVSQTTTSETGEFSVADLQPGNYSIFVAGQNQFAAQGIAIEANSSDADNDFVTMTTIETKYSGIQELMAKTLPTDIADSVNSGSVMRSVSDSEVAIAKKVRIINGKLRGQITSLISESNVEGVQVHLLQDNKPVAQVETDSMGKFSIPDFEAGTYDFVAAGPSGFAAIRVEAIGSRSPMTMVSYNQAVPSLLSVPLAEDCPCNQPAPAEQPIEYQVNNQVAMEPASQSSIEYVGESVGCGCAGGGSAGNYGNFSNSTGSVLGNSRGFLSGGSSYGGGGFGAAGGLGGGAAGASGLARLIGLGAFATSVAAIADDDSPAASNEMN